MILKKRNLDAESNPEIIFLSEDNKEIKFDNEACNTKVDNLEVFKSSYLQDNLYKISLSSNDSNRALIHNIFEFEKLEELKYEVSLIYIFTTYKDKESETPNESINTPLPISTVISNEDLASTSTMKQFDMPDGYGYVKVKFKNTGSKPFIFTINLGSAAGPMKMSGTVPADGKEHAFINEKTWSSGSCFCKHIFWAKYVWHIKFTLDGLSK